MNSPFPILKYFLGFCVFAVFGGFLAVGFLGEPKQETVLAQAPYADQEGLVRDWMSPGGFGAPECDVPLPLGQAFEHTRELIASTSDEFFNAQGYLQSATEILKGLTAKLNEEQDSVCDFTRCSPQVTDRGPDFVLEVDTWVKSWQLRAHASVCKTEECAGQPCPLLDDYVKGLEAAKANFDTSHQNIKDIFDKPSIAVTEDLRAEDDEKDQKITKAGLARREITSVEETLTSGAPGVIGSQICTLSELEQRKWLAGEIGNKFPMPCKEAIEEGLYWPRAWSENCQQECEEGESKKCADCLGKKDPGPKSSVLARINYKIYGTCKDECKEGFSDKCENCLCSEKLPAVAGSGGITGGATREWSQEECQAWLCSASTNPAGLKDWVCCHETPLIGAELAALYESSVHHPELPEEAAECPGNVCPIEPDGKWYVLTAYAPPCFPEGRCTSQSNEVGFGDIAVFRKNIKHKTKVRVVDLEGGKFDKSSKEYQRTGANYDTINGQDISNLTFCACDVGGDIKNNRIDVWLPSLDKAKEFGVKFGKIQVVSENDPTCCVPKHNCCFASGLKKDPKCKTYNAANNLTAYICTEAGLNACHDENKPEYNTVKKGLCDKFQIEK